MAKSALAFYEDEPELLSLKVTFEDSSLTPEENGRILDRLLEQLGYPQVASNETFVWQPEPTKYS